MWGKVRHTLGRRVRRRAEYTIHTRSRLRSLHDLRTLRHRCTWWRPSLSYSSRRAMVVLHLFRDAATFPLFLACPSQSQLPTVVSLLANRLCCILKLLRRSGPRGSPHRLLTSSLLFLYGAQPSRLNINPYLLVPVSAICARPIPRYRPAFPPSEDDEFAPYPDTFVGTTTLRSPWRELQTPVCRVRISMSFNGFYSALATTHP